MPESPSSHGRSLAVWGVPSAVACGGRFSISVGIKCEAACSPQGWTLEVHDEQGQTLAAATVGIDTWPSTQGLYRAELELVAPETEGRFGWRVTAPAVATAASDGHEPSPGHAETIAHFNVRTVSEAGHRLTVTVVDGESQAPIEGARVVVHPHRTVTDARGVAELDLPQGPYRLFVTGRGFLPLRFDGRLMDTATIRLELATDRGPSDAELWA